MLLVIWQIARGQYVLSDKIQNFYKNSLNVFLSFKTFDQLVLITTLITLQMLIGH